MKQLLGKTTELLRRYPILWAPWLVAVVLNFLLTALSRSWLRRLFERGHVGRSVLGFNAPAVPEYPYLSPQVRRFALVVGGFRELITVCIFTAALVTIAILIKMILEGREPNPAEALRVLASRWRAQLGFVVKFAIALVCVGGIMTLSTIQPLAGFFYGSKWSGIVVWLLSLIAVACAYWFVSSAAIRLLRNSPASFVTLQVRRTAVIIAIAADAAFAPLQAGVRLIETQAGFTPSANSNVLLAVHTLIVSLPRVFAFVALALLAGSAASEEPQQPELTPQALWPQRTAELIRKARE
jgi:hypothetical protein